MIIKAAAYARFSSEMQREESIDAQLRAIRKYADDNNIEIVHEYIDRAKTGTNADRESFQAMLSDSQYGDFSLVIVHKYDRFARNRLDSAISKKVLKGNGVRVVSVLEHLDDTPESIIIEGLLESMSEYFSANLSREVMKGMKENALSCKHTGGKPPLGYRVGEDMRLEIDEREAPTVKFIFDSILNGMTYSEIISELNLRGAKTKKGGTFGKNSIHSILTNEKYTGVYIYNRAASKDVRGKRNNHKSKDKDNIIRIEGGVPQIISKEKFDAVQKLLKKRRSIEHTKSSAKESYLLSGKVFCGVCGNTYCGNRQKNSRGYLYVSYRCNTRSRKGANACPNKEINRDKLEKYVLKLLSDVLFDEKRIPAIIEEYNKAAADNLDSGKEEREAVRKSITRIEKEIDNLVSVIATSGSVALAVGLEKKERELKQLQNQLDALTRQSTELNIDTAQIIRAFNYSKELLLSGKLPKLKQLINLYVERIDIYPDSVNVTLNVIGGIQAKVDSEELSKLESISADALKIQDHVSRRDFYRS